MSVRGTDRREYIDIGGRPTFRGGGGSAFENPQSRSLPTSQPDRLVESASITRDLRLGRTEAIKRKNKRGQGVRRYGRAAALTWP